MYSNIGPFLKNIKSEASRCTVNFHPETLDDPKWTNHILRGIIIVCDVKVILEGSVPTVRLVVV